MKAVPFHGLPRPIQDRLLGSIAGTDPPAPIASVPGGLRAPYLWVLLSVAAGAGVFVLHRLGYGDLQSSLALQPLAFVGGYAALFGALLFGLLQPLAFHLQTGALKYRPGIYVFPSALIDARRPVLQIHPLAEVVNAGARGDVLKLEFADATFALGLGSGPRAQAALQTVLEARDEMKSIGSLPPPPPGAVGEKQRRERVALDPLVEPVFASPLAPSDTLAEWSPVWAKMRVPVAVLVGGAVGFGLFSQRNAGSDEALYAAAKARNDADAYRDYLKNGKKYRDEVTRLDLPHAELRAVEKIGTVDAIEAYRAAHAGSAIDAEILAARAKALRVELEAAKQVGTLAALRTFVEKRPSHGLDEEVRAATHAVFVTAYETYAKGASDASAKSFVQRLLGYAEKKTTLAPPADRPGIAVEIRFLRRGTGKLRTVDKIVGKNTFFLGDVSYPSRYFDVAHATPNEDALAAHLIAKLGTAFPKEVLVWKTADAYADGASLPDATVTTPTLAIAHGEDWSGAAYANNSNPRGIFVGISYAFEGTFVLPGDTTPLPFKLEVARPVPVADLKDLSKTPGTLEEKVYGWMSKGAFAQMEATVLGKLFKDAALPAP